MPGISANVRLELWKRRVYHTDWPDRLAEWAGCDVHRARELLERGNASAEETTRIERACGVSVVALRTGDLLEKAGIDVLRENLRRLIGGLGRGGKKELAAVLGVSQVTVSRWLAGPQRPTRATLAAIARHFGLQAGVDLETEPIFLAVLPVTDKERRESVGELIEGTDVESLRTLYPALEKLLRR